MFIYEIIVSRKKEKRMKNALEVLKRNAIQRKKRRREKHQHLVYMKKEFYFHSWYKVIQKNMYAREENYKRAIVYHMFTNLSKQFKHWYTVVQKSMNERKKILLERQTKSQLRARRMREMAASRLWRRRTLNNCLTQWTKTIIVLKDERLITTQKKERKKKLLQLLKVNEKKEKKEEEEEEEKGKQQQIESKYGSSSSRNKQSSSHHLPSRLPHTQPKTNTLRTRRSNGSTPSKNKKKLQQTKQQTKLSVLDSMNIRAEIHRKKREERRQRYLAADLHKQRYSKWKETISTIIGPDAARAGRMFIKRRAYLLNQKKKKEREDLILKKKQLWAKSVIHDANRCVKGYGFIPWKTYIHEQHQRLHRVEKMKWKSIVSKCYVQWKRNVHDMKR